DEAQERACVLAVQRVEEARALGAIASLGCCFHAVTQGRPPPPGVRPARATLIQAGSGGPAFTFTRLWISSTPGIAWMMSSIACFIERTSTVPVSVATP